MRMFSINTQNRGAFLTGWRRYVLLSVVSVLVLAFCTLGKTSSGFAVFYKAGENGILPISLSLIGIAWFLNKIADLVFSHREGVVHTGLQIFLSALFSVFTVHGVMFETTEKSAVADMLKSDYAHFSYVAALLGGVLFFVILFRLICRLDSISQSCKLFCREKLSGFFGKYLFLNCCWVLILFWLPQYIIRFPGVMTYDNWQSLAMHYGYTEITTQHPLIWNVLMVKLTDLGVAVNIPWLASLVICLMHHILAMLVASYAVCTIKEMGLGKGFLVGVLLFFAVLPPMSMYASTVYNDFIFCLAILLLTVEFVYYLYDRKTFFAKPRHWILTALAVGATILRYNGFYTMLVVAAVVSLRELYLLIKGRVKVLQAILMPVLIIAPLLCGQFLQTALNQRYEAKPLTSRAMLAMPIQQTVRCLIEHGDEIAQEDYEAIHTVLTWSNEKYAEKYNPRNFDGVKESFKVDATGEELVAFMKAWLKLWIQFPETCFAATVNQTYYLFSPLVHNDRYYVSNSRHITKAEPRYGFDPTPYVYKNEKLEPLCKELANFYTNVFPVLPVLGLTVNQAVYTILLFAVSLCGLFRKDRRVLILTVSLLITLGITFIGPAVYDHPRYTYPIMFSMPVLLAAFLLSEGKSAFKEAKL